MKFNFKWVFPLGLILIVLSGVLSIWVINNFHEALRYESFALKVFERADDIHDLILAAETNQRGYILTKNEIYLTNYNSAIAKTPKKIDELFTAIGAYDEFQLQTEASEVRNFYDQRLQELKSTIELVQIGKNQEALNVVKSNLGKNLTEKINDKLDFIKLNTKKVATNHYDFLRKNTRLLIISLSSCLAIAVLLFIINLRIMRNQINLSNLEKSNLEKAKQLAIEASQLKGKFLAIVSHELRTPLNGIIGLSDLLRKSDLQIAERRLAGVIHESGKTLLRIINDILDFSKIESGKLELELHDFDLAEIIQQIFINLEPKASEKSILLTYSIDKNLPKILHGDSERISQVLFNLIGNALKFTSIGSVILKVKSNLDINNKFADVTFSLEDTGIGMTPPQVSELFRPFHQHHKVGTSGEPGSGLGLSISQSIIKSMGGEIKVDSTVNRGSIFWFTIRFTQFSTQKASFNDFNHKKEASSIVKSIFESDETPTILVVEDNSANQITIEMILKRLGANVVFASNGQEAVELVDKASFDLIFMDCQMPIIDGFEATQMLRQKRVRTPVIAMTANASAQDQQACQNAGMNYFLPKPVSIELLSDALKKFLKPEPELIAKETLNDLENKIGKIGKTKVVEAFLRNLKEIESSIIEFEKNNDVEFIHQAAHKHKSSALMVGAVGLAYLYKRVEKAENIQDISRFVGIIKQVTPKIETSYRSL